MTPTILVALDGSVRAKGVFEAAVTLARTQGARLVLYRALVIPPDYSPAGLSKSPDEFPKYLENEAKAEFLVLKAGVPDVACDIRIDETHQPWRGILSAGDAVNADLIVVGSHGYHGWDHVLGTTAGKVANRALRNVMIIHDPAGGAALGAGVDRSRTTSQRGGGA